MPLYRALAESLNTAAIRMSIKIGEAYWPPKQSYHLAKIAALGRSKIVATARAMGVTTPLVDTVSLPVGADEVKMIDMVGANATLASGGMRVTPYAAIEARNSNGKLIYTHAADSGAPVRVLPADKVAEMNNIMTHVVTEGTGRAAQIPGLVDLRQDRHDQQLDQRLVQRLHRQSCRQRLVRQRRQHVDGEHDRRHACRR